MTSKEYWQKRETEHAKKNKMAEQAYAEEIRKTYAYTVSYTHLTLPTTERV